MEKEIKFVIIPRKKLHFDLTFGSLVNLSELNVLN